MANMWNLLDARINVRTNLLVYEIVFETKTGNN